MHPVLLLTHNCLDLTKKCVESVRRQSVDTHIMVIDNGSTDGTLEWLEDHVDYWDAADHNAGVSQGWNAGLEHFFIPGGGCDTVLVLNNDVQLPTFFLAELLSYGVSFVTGFSTEDLKEIGPLFHHARQPLRKGSSI